MKTRLPVVLAVAAPLLCASAPAERPNMILFIADDVSWNDYGCYGNKAARTPNIDQLAANGMRFDNAYLTASSCSPSRCSIVTGRYPHNNGHAAELHRPLPWHITKFPALLREAGYYTALSGKDHMPQDTPPADAGGPAEPWDIKTAGRSKENGGGHADWVRITRERPREKPFFFWFAAYDAHRGWDADKQWIEELYGPMHQPEEVVVPPFLVDNPETRRDLASYYNEVTRFDYFVGATVQELRAQGALDNTLIFVMADNGRPFPRAKTRLHDSGMRTALVAHWPKGIRQPGALCRSLVSAIDLAPTYLAAAGAAAPASVQGVCLLPLLSDPSASVRSMAFSEHNWHDYEAFGRSIRKEGFLYIINQRPEQPWQGPADSVSSPSHKSLQTGRDAGTLSTAQRDTFLAPRPTEELYKFDSDRDQLINLAANPEYSEIKARLQQQLALWQEQTLDSVPENLSPDRFDRETGARIQEWAPGITPGEDRGAERCNNPGPR